ncbi:hypothetical protein [Variovorax paradoxus]|uniref:Uncharacterized protein n=1 Tax=Variovorax paradoxus TaxID=34073 RepID=A0A0H2M6L8_VARPD|nr:hypothetical protein [Variovorax paradoxus]KLN57756.1 hypothetical protein VPARA_12690 [Variovorax paradoxus]
MSIKSSSKNDRVVQALGIYRRIAACNERLARCDDVHALTAALMLPCYQAEFRTLARELTPAEQDELRSVLRRMESADAPEPLWREAPSAVH